MNISGVMIAAAGSGSGKTLLTCGILRALQRKGINLASFKCGPDYIDPMFHEKVLGVPSRNLDPFFTQEEILHYLYEKHAVKAEFSIVEGVMGYYDGIGGVSTWGSSFEVADLLKIPVVLVVNCKGMSGSAAALIQGFSSYRSPSHINGVILNQVSPSIYPELKELIEEETGVAVLGYLPALKGISLESRHLGLITPAEIENLQEQLNLLADQIENSIDLDAFLRLGEKADTAYIGERPDFWKHTAPDWYDNSENRQKSVIAVAQDEAFCFFYQDNLELLEELGAELIYFSPLRDKEVPKEADGLYIPGGYPELYAVELSKNRSMLSSVKKMILTGIPTIAECGGFLYLHQYLEDEKGTKFPMTGVFEDTAYKTERLQRFGYITLKTQKNTMLIYPGEVLRSHEFHYWDTRNPGTDYHAVKASKTKEWDCGYASEWFYAGFPHIYFYAMPNAAIRFVKACEKYKNQKENEG